MPVVPVVVCVVGVVNPVMRQVVTVVPGVGVVVTVVAPVMGVVVPVMPVAVMSAVTVVVPRVMAAVVGAGPVVVGPVAVAMPPVAPVVGGPPGGGPHHRDGQRLADVDDLVRAEVVGGEQLVGPGVEANGEPGGGVAGTHRVVHHPTARVAVVVPVVVPTVMMGVMPVVVVPVPRDQLDAWPGGDVVDLDLLHGDAGGQHQGSGRRSDATAPDRGSWGRPRGRRLGRR